MCGLNQPVSFYSDTINPACKWCVTGMSITCDTNPHKHIWSYAGSYRPVTLPVWAVCSCNSELASSQSSPSLFVGNNYYCESGVQVSNSEGTYLNGPLWDGQTCPGNEASRCTVSKIPRFLKSLRGVVNDDIEMRLCGNEVTNDEDTFIELIEIYVG